MEKPLIFTKVLNETERAYSFELIKQGNPNYRLLIYRQSTDEDSEKNSSELKVCGNHLKEIIDVLVEYHAYITSDSQVPFSPPTEAPIKTSYADMVAKKRERYPRAYAPWVPEDDEELTFLFQQKLPTKELAKIFGRNPGAIRARIKKLGLED